MKATIWLEVFLNSSDKTLLIGFVVLCEYVIMNLAGEGVYCSLSIQYMKSNVYALPLFLIPDV